MVNEVKGEWCTETRTCASTSYQYSQSLSDIVNSASALLLFTWCRGSAIDRRRVTRAESLSRRDGRLGFVGRVSPILGIPVPKIPEMRNQNRVSCVMLHGWAPSGFSLERYRGPGVSGRPGVPGLVAHHWGRKIRRRDRRHGEVGLT
jgi:hypothetical protein